MATAYFAAPAISPFVCSTQKVGWANKRRSSSRGDAPRRGDDGAITAEFAVALPAVILVLAFVLVLTNIALTAATLQSAARSGARLAAVESDTQIIHNHVAQLTGPGATIGVSLGQTWATVTLSKNVTVGPFNLGTFQLHSSAASLREEQVGQW